MRVSKSYCDICGKEGTGGRSGTGFPTHTTRVWKISEIYDGINLENSMDLCHKCQGKLDRYNSEKISQMRAKGTEDDFQNKN